MLLPIMLAALTASHPALQCAAAGRSVDQDPAGLHVRAGPSPRARVLGRLFSVLDTEALNHGSRERYGPIFAIREVRGGWVRIADTAAAVEGADGEVRQNYIGPGWISANFVHPTIVSMGAGDPGSRGYAGPDFAAAVVDPDGLANVERMRYDLRRHPRILACRGHWLQLEYIQVGRLSANGQWVDFSPSERRPARAWFRSGDPGE